MNANEPERRYWEGGSLILLLLILLVGVVLAAILQFTGKFDFTVFL